MNNYNKYLKYKSKYLNLKNLNDTEQNGGFFFKKTSPLTTDLNKNIFLYSLNCSDIIYYLEKYDDLYKYVDKLDKTIYEDLLLKLNIKIYIDNNFSASALINACKKYNENNINNFKISQDKQSLIDIATSKNSIGNRALDVVNKNLYKLKDEDIRQILHFARNYNIRLSWLIEILINNKLDDFLEVLHTDNRDNKSVLSNEDLENAYKKLGLIMHKS
jgi:hypothetical protein